MFPSEEGLRPTSDRVRETLFNWLAPVLPGALCLDLFAGSGVLGFEAASRGAKRVVLVEKSARACRSIEQARQLLDANSVELLHIDALQYLSSASVQAFDVVFLDPPYGTSCLQAVYARLQEIGGVAEGGLVYIEMSASDAMQGIPVQWQLLKEKRAGHVIYRLFRNTGSAG